ncbi:DUF4160 domain-containing protein [Methylobacterium sp. J-070]|uniref:DUF4160 domain-containing protein n=1 Tax=Methylobacterium sp. J-070 TaxID=2836650 RepID=UPI001FBC03B9|nr:DUF4160 domain-containing protein [Methylobacterium sp. J-070]MCJ2048229.1 DUF4160 domain-containing protein [Methylobacterium sp. J-070]
MGRLARIGNVIVRIIAGDHLPPHFHAIGPDFEAFIVIETPEMFGATSHRARAGR